MWMYRIKPGRMYPFDERIELRIEIRPVTVSDVHPIDFELNFKSYLSLCVNSSISLLKTLDSFNKTTNHIMSLHYIESVSS